MTNTHDEFDYATSNWKTKWVTHSQVAV